MGNRTVVDEANGPGGLTEALAKLGFRSPAQIGMNVMRSNEPNAVKPVKHPKMARPQKASQFARQWSPDLLDFIGCCSPPFRLGDAVTTYLAASGQDHEFSCDVEMDHAHLIAIRSDARNHPTNFLCAKNKLIFGKSLGRLSQVHLDRFGQHPAVGSAPYQAKRPEPEVVCVRYSD